MFKAFIPAVVLAASLCSAAHAAQEDIRVSEPQVSQAQQCPSPPLSGKRPDCLGDRHGNTALMGTLFKGESAIARRLIETRCPIDQTNNAGETALGFATLFNRFDLIPVLVKHGADPNHVDGRGQSLLQLALAHDNVEAADALRQASAQR